MNLIQAYILPLYLLGWLLINYDVAFYIFCRQHFSNAVRNSKTKERNMMSDFVDSYREQAIDYLLQKALAERSKAKMSLKMLLDHPAGIGDHSTDDLYKNLDEALDMLVDAEDRLDILAKYEDFT